MQPFTAVLSEGKVVVPSQSEADSLRSDGYGHRQGSLYVLEPAESLYNVERQKISVVDEDTNRVLSFQELLKIFNALDPGVWTRFLVYRDLRTRGFTAITDLEGEADLVVYERGGFMKGPPTIRVFIVSEGSPERLDRLIELTRRFEAEELQLKLAVVDRRGEMVYYGLAERRFQAAD
jgi:tRNA-intron endonuclease